MHYSCSCVVKKACGFEADKKVRMDHAPEFGHPVSQQTIKHTRWHFPTFHSPPSTDMIIPAQAPRPAPQTPPPLPAQPRAIATASTPTTPTIVGSGGECARRESYISRFLLIQKRSSCTCTEHLAVLLVRRDDNKVHCLPSSIWLTPSVPWVEKFLSITFHRKAHFSHPVYSAHHQDFSHLQQTVCRHYFSCRFLLPHLSVTLAFRDLETFLTLAFHRYPSDYVFPRFCF